MKINENIQLLEAENNSLKNKVAELQTLVKWYEEQFKLAKQQRFGKSSEKTELLEQLSIFNEAETQQDKNIPEPTIEEVITYKRKKRIGKRDELFKDIPTIQVVHELPADERVCPKCGNLLHACGHEVARRELEIIPAQVRAVEHVQTAYSCRKCENTADDNAVPMLKAKTPSPVIAGSGVASASLLSYIICNKYVLALPLYRQEQELARLGVELSRQTMANWIIYVANKWIAPLYELMRDELLATDLLHADETTMQVIKETGRTANQESYMWLYRTAAGVPSPIVMFDYQPTRSSSHPKRFLNSYTGYLHADAYVGYKSLESQGVIIVECWAHVRRKFHDALKILAKHERTRAPANTGYVYCNKLFELERLYDEENISDDERHKRRIIESKPIAEAFFAWAKEERQKPTTMGKSVFGKAITYAINQEQWLINIYQDGRLAISNNLAESSIRPFAIGRNNWMFAFSSKGAKASSMMYSIVETAKANGIVPFIYFNYLLEHMPKTSPDHFKKFLPWTSEILLACKQQDKH